ncbi:hypothetical protein D3C73_1244220 [compost metagenome]
MFEVLPRLSGPMRPIFSRGCENLRNGIPITVFLEGIVKTCPDSYLQLVFAGLLHEQKESGDQRKFVEEIMNDMRNQEKFERNMLTDRKQTMQMLIYVICFPVVMYILFSEPVNRTMDLHPWTIGAFVLGIAGYVLIIWLGYRFTRTKL